ncbi:acyl-CoA dehydrogenase [Myxococcus stipitatus DSM 14675]|uniref:Acyl-CoA dehydrogenase n=1 Tax=Myxococcus stipitatus (strain DSM 14675 / JCM 12634 / Mx s8) TaxID=1278073 RepID=L7UER9_MYXSD|nr:acyl-CoA dehydrogenase family protein [Myxococcus stipitatus]AGC46112.1 acyl-CoA dehydrogenase [Myxococcus stipitatus DSM 14675]
MDFAFTEAQQTITGLARKLFTEHVTPATLAASDVDFLDRGLWARLATMGLLGTAIPEAAGGSGHGMRELGALLVEAGAAVAPVPLWPTLVLGALPIGAFGTPEQRQRWLPGVVEGRTFLTAALTEDSPHPASTGTLATHQGGRWRLTGIKSCVPAAHLAARILVPARTHEGALGVFLLDPHTPGVSTECQRATTGEPQLRLTLSDALVEPEDVLAGPGDGDRVLTWLMERATVGVCALHLGVVERALRLTAEYTGTRHQFGRPIATFQAVSQRAADASIDVEAIRLTLWKAACALDSGQPAEKAVATAKLWASEAGHRVVSAAQHLHGGIGFDTRYPLYRSYLWSKQLELTLGSGTVHLARLGALLAEG